MSRVKRGTMHTKRRRKILKTAKGFSSGRKNLIKQAKTAITKAGNHAYIDRRKKKRVFRGLWSIKINAAARQNDTTYSKLMSALKEKKVSINRKMLADIAKKHPNVFSKLVKQTK